MGIVCSIIADKLNIPNVLLLILSGIILGNISYHGERLITLSPVFLTSVAILALVMIVFDGSSGFKWRDIDTFSVRVLKLVLVFLYQYNIRQICLRL